MLSLVGEDRPGIVAKVTEALHKGGCNLGETSMMRLGGSFTIMMMTDYGGSPEMLESMLKPVADSMNLALHIDKIDGSLRKHLEPDTRISVFGADRAGIVAQVTGALAKAGFNILDLESDVGGTPEKPIYIMHIEGVSSEGIESVNAALKEAGKDIEISVSRIDTLVG